MEVSSLPASVTEVVHDGTTYYIVGTAHVSQRSVDEVRAVIAMVEPDLVCVELDKARFEALTKDSAFRDLDVFKVVREGRGLYLLGHLALSSYQRRIGATLGVKPGAELLAATAAATEKGIPVELIDRDINITLRRTWRNLGLWKRSQLLTSLVVGWEDDDDKDKKKGKDEPPKGIGEQIEDLKEPEALSQMLAKLGEKVPEIKTPLIDERDQYLASKLVEAGTGKKRVVAVVGAAHVPGMLPQIGKTIDRAKLDAIPPPSLVWTIIKWLIPALFIGALIYGWKWSESSSISELMLAWILPTSIGAGTLTLLAGGSLFSVVSALVVAPIAAIHPLLGTGMVVGVVEAWRRKPSVADCERLP
ncbi:MAG: TraB family protein [Deltaproteobacteria bacterium]|nr:TraB family protein [Deltaproteobacteria bacterium]